MDCSRPLQILDGVLYGQDELVADFVASRIPGMQRGFGPCVALGHIRGRKLVGGVVFHNYAPQHGDIEMSLAFDRPPTPSRATLRRLFDFPFRQLGLHRISIRVAADNTPINRLAQGYGFQLEGRRREARLGADELIYGMLQSECRFLGRENHG
jgi:RimJ/RimL family protein N-acetyltransferase